MKSFISFYFLLFLNFSVSAQNKEAILQLHHNFKELAVTNFNAALKNAHQALLMSEQLLDKNLLFQSYKNLSEILYYKKENTEATTYHQKALQLAIETQNEKEFATLYNLWGSLEKQKNNFKKALQYYETALLWAKKYHLLQESNVIQNNLARLYRILDDKNQAFAILRTTLVTSQKEKDTLNLANTYNILGALYFEEKKDSALLFYEKAYSLAKKNQNKYLESIIASNLGDLSLSLNRFKKSLTYLKHSEKISQKIGDSSSLHYINISLGIYYERIGNYPQAIKKYTKAIKDYGSYVEDAQKTKALWVASGVFYHAEKYKEAYLYLDEFIALNEDVLALEKKKEFEKIRITYEVEKKNNAIALLEKEKKLANTNKKIIIISSLSISFFLLLLVFLYKHRIKVQKKLQDQKNKLFKSEKERLLKEQEIKKIQGYLDGQEKEKNRIATELHDGIAGELAGIKHLLYAIDENNNEVHRAANTISSITKNVRLLSHNLSTTYITNNSLIHLLADLKNSYEHTNMFKITMNTYPDNCFDFLKESYKHHLYRITQELLNNIKKYANAKEVRISFVKQKEYLSFIIEDNGVGFSDEKEGLLGIGLNNVKNRVATLNGKIQIDSKINIGTTIAIEIPN